MPQSLRSPPGVLVLFMLSLHVSRFHVSERNDYKALLMGGILSLLGLVIVGIANPREGLPLGRIGTVPATACSSAEHGSG